MRPKVKYHVIYKHRTEYPVSVMCRFFGVSRSGYYAFVHRQGKPEKDAALAEVIAQQWERSYRTYGYRRMWLWLKHQNIFCNPKTVLRIMKKYELLSEIRRRRKWQQMGQQVHKYKNLLNREFHADRPNRDVYKRQALNEGVIASLRLDDMEIVFAPACVNVGVTGVLFFLPFVMGFQRPCRVALVLLKPQNCVLCHSAPFPIPFPSGVFHRENPARIISDTIGMEWI